MPVLFDMDGLLLDTERLFQQAFVEVAAPYGLSEPRARAFFTTLVGSSVAHTQNAVEKLLPGVEFQQFDRAWADAMRGLVEGGIPLRPTVWDTVHALAGQGVQMAVVTSTHRSNARHHLEQVGILPLLSGLICGDDVDRPKPDPQPYILGAQTLSMNSSDCFAFEDSDLGTQAAVAAGCQTRQIPDLRPENKPLPDLGQGVFSSLWDAVQDAGLIRAVV